MDKKISSLIYFLNKNNFVKEAKYLSGISKYASKFSEAVLNSNINTARAIAESPNLYATNDEDKKDIMRAAVSRGLYDDDLDNWKIKENVDKFLSPEEIQTLLSSLGSEMQAIKDEASERDKELSGGFGEEKLEKIRYFLKSDDEDSRGQGYLLAEAAMDMGAKIHEIFGIPPLEQVFGE